MPAVPSAALPCGAVPAADCLPRAGPVPSAGVPAADGDVQGEYGDGLNGAAVHGASECDVWGDDVRWCVCLYFMLLRVS